MGCRLHGGNEVEMPCEHVRVYYCMLEEQSIFKIGRLLIRSTLFSDTDFVLMWFFADLACVVPSSNGKPCNVDMHNGIRPWLLASFLLMRRHY